MAFSQENDGGIVRLFLHEYNPSVSFADTRACRPLCLLRRRLPILWGATLYTGEPSILHSYSFWEPPALLVLFYIQKDREIWCFSVLSFFLRITDLIKNNKVIFLLNFQALLTNRQKHGTIYTLHKLHMFIRWRENTLVKSVFSLSSYLHRLGICVATMRGMHFFGAFLHWGALF